MSSAALVARASDAPSVHVEARPAFVDAAACRAWLDELPLADVEAANVAIERELARLAAFDECPPGRRVDLAELLRPHVLDIQAELARKFRGKPAPLTPARRDAFAAVNRLWDTLARLYQGAAEAIGKREDDMVALAACRGLDATARKLREHHHAYVRVQSVDLRRLHRLFGFADLTGVVRQRVKDPLANDNAAITCELVYIRALLLEAATTREHRQSALAVIERWIDTWSARVKVLAAPSDAITSPPLYVALDGDGGLQREPVRGPAARVFDVSALGATLEKRIHGLRHGKKLLELDLGNELSKREFEHLLVALFRQWCEAPSLRRRHDRQKVASFAHVSRGMLAAHFYLSRRPFTQPFARADLPASGDAAAELERIRAATDYMRAHGVVAEEWSVRDESLAGLGMVRSPSEHAETSLTHGMLLAIRPRGGGTVLVAALQWMEEALEGELQIGVRLLPGAPMPVATRMLGQDRFVPALLLAPIAGINAPSSVVLPPGTFAPNRVIEIFVKGIDRVQLTGLLEVGVDYERAAYMPAGMTHAAH